MQISTYRTIALGLLLALALGNCSDPKTGTLQAGDLQVQVTISPDPPMPILPNVTGSFDWIMP